MHSSRFVRFFSLSFFLVTLINHPLAFAQPKFLKHLCNNTGDSTYKANLDHVLSSLTTDHKTIDYGFYNLSYGQTNKANVIGLCRGDVSPATCRQCLNNSANLLRLRCPNQKEAIGWYDYCMLRYSDRPIFGVVEDEPVFTLWNQNDASDPERFNGAAWNLIEKLIGEAALGDSRMKFAIGNTTAPNLPIIYGLAQCTPDLSHQQCNRCLLNAFGQVRNCCDGKQGGRVMKPSCHFRYESYTLIKSPLPPPPPPSQPPLSLPPPPLLPNSTQGKKKKRGTVWPVAVVIVAVMLITSICFCIRRKPKINTAKRPSHEDEITNVGPLQFDFDTIRIATDEFSDANKLGEGGFGAVYKGKLPNGRNVAVKRLSQISSQGDVEFKNELMLVAKLHHRNLVQLWGFCCKENEKLLIYEFVHNSSLDKFIFDPIKRPSLDWEKRYKIIQGIVRGLVYLHEDSRIKIIHRDLKASNILLDGEMNAKISDFGIAKLCVTDQTRGDTSTIIGTNGYMAPEYARHGRFSIKSDVFSFGVLVLEIVSGQRNNDVTDDVEDHLISYAWRNWREGTPLNIVDPSIQSGSRTEMMRCIQIGLLCVQENLNDRPIMTTVLLMLNSCSVTLPTPSQPS